MKAISRVLFALAIGSVCTSNPVHAGNVIVGCVRDSITGLPIPRAEILDRYDRIVARADSSGWFVLEVGRRAPRRLRAHVFCRAGGYRDARGRNGPGDVVTLFIGQGTCIIDGR